MTYFSAVGIFRSVTAPACTSCWMNMNLRSMCLARLDTPILVAMLPEDGSVPTLMLIFLLPRIFCRKFLRNNASVVAVPMA